MGWNSSWLQNFLHGTGNYIGLLGMRENVTVPTPNYESGKLEKMKSLLTNIGYQPDSSSSTVNNDSCFHFNLKMSSSVYSLLAEKPVIGGNTFTTVDFCAKMESGKIKTGSDSIYHLEGNSERGDYDGGHIRDDSNVIYFTFYGSNPFTPHYVTYNSTPYLQARLHSFYMSYRTSLQDTMAGVNMTTALPFYYNAISDKDIKNGDCSAAGYAWCGNIQTPGLIPGFPTNNLVASIAGGGAPNGLTLQTFKSGLKTLLESMKVKAAVTGNEYVLFDSVVSENLQQEEDSYKKGNSNTKFLNYFLSSVNKYNSGALNPAERYMLYYTYLKDNYGTATSTREVDGGVKVSWLDEATGTFSKVYIYNAANNSSDKYYALDDNSKWDNYTMGDWQYFANSLAAIDVESAFNVPAQSIVDPDVQPGGVPDDPNPGSTDNGTVDKCYSAAASLGWILCPVLNGTSKALTGIYDMVIEPFLEIKSSFFDANSNGGGLRNGWVQFRDFANILFAIAFAVIIFAQATGIGISNYNIKKILPRLIMVAVLVNISFILCQIAVDISNILGSSLQKLFADMAGRVGVPSGSGLDAMVDSITGEQVTWFSLGGIVSTIMTVILGGAGAIALVVTWEIWLIPFLLAILGCLLGVLFFFIILGIRQAGVLLLIALAPIAIVCYALPNTKSIFDKWLKMFEGLLLVYPICGILIGGGQFASALLISAGGGTNFFYDLVAMLVSVVPFFLVPSILKSSMAAMGNLGLRVSQFGQNLGHRMNAGIRNSEWGVTHSAD